MNNNLLIPQMCKLHREEIGNIYFPDNAHLTTFMDDHYIVTGLRFLFAEFLSQVNTTRDYVIFSCDHYYEARNLTRFKPDSIFIMIYSYNDYRFIEDDFIHHRIHKKTNPMDFLKVIIKGEISKPRKNNLTIQDLIFTNLVMTGEAMPAIGTRLNILVKRSYQVREGISKKLGCHHAHDFNRLCVSKTFSDWLKIQLHKFGLSTHDWHSVRTLLLSEFIRSDKISLSNQWQ